MGKNWRSSEADRQRDILNVGHAGTYREPNGGRAAAAVVAWLDWQLRRDRRAAKTFVGKIALMHGCRLDGGKEEHQLGGAPGLSPWTELGAPVRWTRQWDAQRVRACPLRTRLPVRIRTHGRTSVAINRTR